LLLRQRIKSLIRNKVQYDTIADVETELSSLITEGAWTEKEIIRLNAKISELRKQQGFTRIARAFMATMINPEDPFQVTASLIHRNPSYDMLQFPQVCNTPIHGFDDLLLLDNLKYIIISIMLKSLPIQKDDYCRLTLNPWTKSTIS